MERDPSAEPPHGSAKAGLLEQIGASWEALEQTLWGLSPEELTAPRPPDGWSVKDHLSHLAAWETILLAILEGRDRGDAIGLTPDAAAVAADMDALNAFLYERHKDRPLADVQADLRQIHAQVLAKLASLSDEDLRRPYAHFQPNDQPPDDRPVLGWIAGNTYEHFEEHRGWLAEQITSGH